jgi:hypothetical protein
MDKNKSGAKVVNPLTGRLVEPAYLKKLEKSGRISALSVATSKVSPAASATSVTSPKMARPASPVKATSPASSSGSSSPAAQAKSTKKLFSTSYLTDKKAEFESMMSVKPTYTGKKAKAFYKKAYELVGEYKMKQTTNKFQTELFKILLKKILLILNQNKGDDFEREELFSEIYDAFQITFEMFNERKDKYKKYIAELEQQTPNDKTSFEAKMYKIVEDVYGPSIYGVQGKSSSGSASASSGISAPASTAPPPRSS